MKNVNDMTDKEYKEYSKKCMAKERRENKELAKLKRVNWKQHRLSTYDHLIFEKICARAYTFPETKSWGRHDVYRDLTLADYVGYPICTSMLLKANDSDFIKEILWLRAFADHDNARFLFDYYSSYVFVVMIGTDKQRARRKRKWVRKLLRKVGDRATV